MTYYAVARPDAEYHEIVPGLLYQGGHVWKDGDSYCDATHSNTREEDWDYVVSAYVEPLAEKTFPKCDTRFVLFEDTEDGLSDETWAMIRNAVGEVVYRISVGQKVLIRCNWGLNRSGMMVAFVLMSLGMKADNAIKMLRNLRSQHVLTNPVFEGYVRSRQTEYRNAHNSWIIKDVVDPKYLGD